MLLDDELVISRSVICVLFSPYDAVRNIWCCCRFGADSALVRPPFGGVGEGACVLSLTHSLGFLSFVS